MKRKIDELGRLVIPKEIRTEIGLNDGDSVEIQLEDNRIIVTNPQNIDYKTRVEKALKKIQEQMPFTIDDKDSYEVCNELLSALCQIRYILETGVSDEDYNTYR